MGGAIALGGGDGRVSAPEGETAGCGNVVPLLDAVVHQTGHGGGCARGTGLTDRRGLDKGCEDGDTHVLAKTIKNCSNL